MTTGSATTAESSSKPLVFANGAESCPANSWFSSANVALKPTAKPCRSRICRDLTMFPTNAKHLPSPDCAFTWCNLKQLHYCLQLKTVASFPGN